MKKKILHLGRPALGMLVGMLLLAPLAHAQEDSTGIAVSADTYVRSTSPDNSANFGTVTTFLVRNSLSSYMMMGLLKFDASAISLPANVKLDSAKVFLTTGSTLNAAINVNLISVSDATDNWDESTITWDSYKAGDVDTLATVATTHVGAKNTRYSWDITDHLRSEILEGNKIVSLAVFQDYNTGAATSFVTKDSVTDDINKPLLAVYTHVVPVKVINFAATPDTAAGTIALNWETPIETGTTNWAVERSTDGVNFTEIHSEAAGGTTTDTTSYSYTDAPAIGATYYYRIRYDVTSSSSIYSDIISTPFYSTIALEDFADSYVYDGTTGGHSGDNKGSDPSFTVKNDGAGNSSYTRYGYLKFDLSSYTGTDVAHSAKLLLHVASANTSVKNGSTTWYLWRCADNSWDESTITGQNAPLRDSTYGSSGYLSSLKVAANVGDVVEFDVPADVINDALAGDKLLTISITSNDVGSTDDASFATKENTDASLQPQLVVEMASESASLPVKLSPLSATATSSGISLNWKSYTELNTSHYSIERSTDGSSFSSIGTVAAAGNSSTAHSYIYTDGQPAIGLNYYRLRAVDADGQSSLSNVVSINYQGVAGSSSWSVYPNPVRKGANATIRLNASVTGNVTVKVVDMSGHICLNQIANSIGNNLYSFGTSALSNGVYIVQLYDGQGKAIGSSAKIIIQ